MTFFNPQIVSAVLALSIAMSIFWLIRRDYLIQRDGIKWIVIALGVLLYGINPALNDSIGNALGIGYPPIIVVLIALAVTLIKLLIADIERAKLQMSVTRLIQKVAILESRLEESLASSQEKQ
ncbi:DUF2304 domain-containing protein [Planctobacterium marinum]|uniref:DUF2304 domain-containing protein n=1 Tax=Planctobacterium marinum TaxID=1631968 RepID=UPI001E63C8E2|nr:DUF2304 domain-containing protein [Planctobacterium marinum]MCC2606103.1 DUF2304 domain-containing protein [Planctobacterium marinum]